MEPIIKISIAENFSKTPGPRLIKEGSNSAELFLQQSLEEQFKSVLDTDSKLEINLDGTLGYGTSFLEEIFGGLARKYGADNVTDKIDIISKEEPWLIDEIKSYVKDVKEQSE